MEFDPQSFLETAGKTKDQDINIAQTALAIAARTQPETNLERYFNNLKKLGEETAVAHAKLLQEGAEDNAESRHKALQETLFIEQGYSGDQQNYDDLQNASLIRVIERRKGLPIALCILYIHAGRAQGWDIEGLSLPGHFVCRLEHDGQRLIFDPFHDAKVLEAPDLRQIVKQTAGPHAELSAQYFEPSSNRDILIRLQNNIKYRLIDVEDYTGALEAVEVMRLIDPEEFRLLLDAGVLYARTEQPIAAIAALEDYIAVAPHDNDRHEAAMLLQDLKSALN